MNDSLVVPSDPAYRERALPLVEHRLAQVAHQGGPALRRFVDALVEHRMPLGLSDPVVRTVCPTCAVATVVPVLELGWLTYCDVCGHRMLRGDTPWSEIVGPRPPNQIWGVFDHRSGRVRQHSLGLRAELVVGRRRIGLPGGDIGARHLLAGSAGRPSRLLIHNTGQRPLASGLLSTHDVYEGARDPLPLIEPGEATILSLQGDRSSIRLFVGAEHTLEERAIPVISLELAADLAVEVRLRGLQPVEGDAAGAAFEVAGDAAGVALRFSPVAPPIEGATATLTIGDDSRRLLAHVRRRSQGPPDHEWLAVDPFAHAEPGSAFRVEVRYRAVLGVISAAGRLAGAPEVPVAPPATTAPARSAGAARGRAAEDGQRGRGDARVGADGSSPRPPVTAPLQTGGGAPARGAEAADRPAPPAHPGRGPAADGRIGERRAAVTPTGRPWNVPLVLSVQAGAVAARRLDEPRPLSMGQALADDVFAVDDEGRVRVGLAALDWALDDWKQRPLGTGWWQVLTAGQARVLDPARPVFTAVGRPLADRGPVTAEQVLAGALDAHLRAISTARPGHPDQIALVLPPRATELHVEGVQRLLASAAPSAELFLELDTSAALVLDALRTSLVGGAASGARRVLCVMLEPHETVVAEHRVRWQPAPGRGQGRLEVHVERGPVRGLPGGLDGVYGVIEGLLHQGWSRAQDSADRQARESRASDERVWLFDASRRQIRTGELRDRRLALMRGANPPAVGADGLSATTRLPVEQEPRAVRPVDLPIAERLILGCLARYALGALESSESVRIGESPEQRRLLRRMSAGGGGLRPGGRPLTLERNAVVGALRPALARLLDGLRGLADLPPPSGGRPAPGAPTARAVPAEARAAAIPRSGLPGLPTSTGAAGELTVVVHAPGVVCSALASGWAEAGLASAALLPAPFEQRPELRGAVDYYAATRFGLGDFEPIVDPVGQRVLVAVSRAGGAAHPLIPCGCALGSAWAWLPVERPACMLHFVSWAGQVVGHAVRSLDGLSFIGGTTFADVVGDPQAALRVWVESRFDERRRAVMGEIVRLEGGTWGDARGHVERVRRGEATPAARSGPVLRPACTLPDGMHEAPLTVAPFEFHDYPGFLLDPGETRAR